MVAEKGHPRVAAVLKAAQHLSVPLIKLVRAAPAPTDLLSAFRWHKNVLYMIPIYSSGWVIISRRICYAYSTWYRYHRQEKIRGFSAIEIFTEILVALAISAHYFHQELLTLVFTGKLSSRYGTPENQRTVTSSISAHTNIYGLEITPCIKSVVWQVDKNDATVIHHITR